MLFERYIKISSFFSFNNLSITKYITPLRKNEGKKLITKLNTCHLRQTLSHSTFWYSIKLV